VLAIVEEQKKFPVGEGCGQRVRGRVCGAVRDPQCCSHSPHHGLRIGDRRQFDEPHAVPVTVAHPAGYVQGEPGLAYSPCADEGDRPAVGEPLLYRGQVGFAAYERRDLGWQGSGGKRRRGVAGFRVGPHRGGALLRSGLFVAGFIPPLPPLFEQSGFLPCLCAADRLLGMGSGVCGTGPDKHHGDSQCGQFAPGCRIAQGCIGISFS